MPYFFDVDYRKFTMIELIVYIFKQHIQLLFADILPLIFYFIIRYFYLFIYFWIFNEHLIFIIYTVICFVYLFYFMFTFFIYILLCITDIFIPLGTNTVFFNEKIYIDIWYTFMCCIQAFALILFFDVCNKPNFVYINSILYTLLSSISGLTIIYMNYIPYLANDAYIQYCVFRCFFNLSSSIMLLLYSLYSYYL